jgi:hypothetical protein
VVGGICPPALGLEVIILVRPRDATIMTSTTTAQGLLPLLRRLKDVSLLERLPYDMLAAHYKHVIVGDLFQHQMLYARVFERELHRTVFTMYRDYEDFRCARLASLMVSGCFTDIYAELGPFLLSSYYLKHVFHNYVDTTEESSQLEQAWFHFDKFSLKEAVSYWPMLLHFEKTINCTIGKAIRHVYDGERHQNQACFIYSLESLSLLPMFDGALMMRGTEMHALDICIKSGTSRMLNIEYVNPQHINYFVDYKEQIIFTASGLQRIVFHLLNLRTKESIQEVVPASFLKYPRAKLSQCRGRIKIDHLTTIKHVHLPSGAILDWDRMVDDVHDIPVVVTDASIENWISIPGYREQRQIKLCNAIASGNPSMILGVQLFLLLPLLTPLSPSNTLLTRISQLSGDTHLFTLSQLCQKLQSYLPRDSPYLHHVGGSLSLEEELKLIEEILSEGLLRSYHIQVFQVNTTHASKTKDWQHLTNVLRVCPLFTLYRPVRVVYH